MSPRPSPFSGEPRTWYLPSASSTSSGAASSRCAAILRALSCTFSAARATDSPPTASERDPEGPPADGAAVGVAVPAPHLLGRDADPVRDDLREAGVVPLPVRGGAGPD